MPFPPLSNEMLSDMTNKQQDRHAKNEGNIFCTCPKPLLSVFEICGFCLRTRCAVSNDGFEHGNTAASSRCLSEVDFNQLP